MRTCANAVVLLMVVHGLIGCGGKSSQPLAPTAVPAPAPAAGVLRLNGYVYDTGFRPIAAAALEVLDGPQAGTTLTSESDGHFSYTGSFAGTVTMRATKEGYVSAVETVHIYTGGPWIYFDLVSIVPAIDIAGNYLLTIAADPACTMLPEEVRTRNYPVLVKPANTPTPIPGLFDAIATDGEFAPMGGVFSIGVSGNYVGISTVNDTPLLVESLGSNRYLAYSVTAGVTDVVSGAATIASPFTGTIEYCELQSPIGQYYDCSTAYKRREQCTGNNGRLTLARR